MLVFENCLYKPDGYQLFKDAPDDGLAEYEQYAEAPLRSFLRDAGAQQTAAWLPAPEYMKTNSLNTLPAGTEIIYVDRGTAGEVTALSGNRGHVITLYDESPDGSAVTETLSKFTQNHLTVDVGWINAWIASEMETGLAIYEAKQTEVARAAERVAGAFIAKGQRDAAEKKKLEAEHAQTNLDFKKKKRKKKKRSRKRSALNDQEQNDVVKQHMIFDLLDTDGSNEIEKAEMEVIETTDGYDFTADDVKRAFKEMDSDGSGLVTFDEFQLWLDEESLLAMRLWEQSSAKLLLEQESRVHLVPFMPTASNNILIGGHVTDKADWVTVRACRCVSGGRWYYEVLLGDSTSCRIGFASTDMIPVADESQAESQHVQPLGQPVVGDVDTPGSSWGYDGSQGVKVHKGPLPYAASASRWKANDVIGCILDLDAGTIA